MCDQNGHISNVVARWPGSVHDSTIFDNSDVQYVTDSSVNDGYLIDDEGVCLFFVLKALSSIIISFVI